MSRSGPNLFVVGAPKCGTTSLHRYLDQHPAVFMSPLKEPRYWSSDLRAAGRAFERRLVGRQLIDPRRWSGLPAAVRRARLRSNHPSFGITTERDYLDLFRAADPAEHEYRGEASPDSMWSSVAARDIAAYEPNARIIITLREPISYIVSAYREALAGTVGEDVASLEQALALEPKRLRGRAVPTTARYPFSVCYRAQARFDVQIQRFLDAFAHSQIHVMVMERLAHDVVGEVDRLFAFLDLAPIAGDLDLTAMNQSPSEVPQLSAPAADALRAEFQPVVDRLEMQTGLPLAQWWGYD